jgi:basic membrane lipoprotein Med (substrate-binding protein (PBP1-ABC) superfamily)
MIRRAARPRPLAVSLLALVGLALLAACATTRPVASAASTDFGVLLMAHGGDQAWDREVAQAMAPLRQEFPLEIAFGMADAGSIERAVQRLEAQGAQRIGVVRLFVTGESWYERTEQILGLSPGAPARPADADRTAHGGHAMSFWRVGSAAAFALSREGLSEAQGDGRRAGGARAA